MSGIRPLADFPITCSHTSHLLHLPLLSQRSGLSERSGHALQKEAAARFGWRQPWPWSSGDYMEGAEATFLACLAGRSGIHPLPSHTWHLLPRVPSSPRSTGT